MRKVASRLLRKAKHACIKGKMRARMPAAIGSLVAELEKTSQAIENHMCREHHSWNTPAFKAREAELKAKQARLAKEIARKSKQWQRAWK